MNNETLRSEWQGRLSIAKADVLRYIPSITTQSNTGLSLSLSSHQHDDIRQHRNPTGKRFPYVHPRKPTPYFRAELKGAECGRTICSYMAYSLTKGARNLSPKYPSPDMVNGRGREFTNK